MHRDVLGISAFYHDSAAAIVRDGQVIAAVQEERLTRVKGDSRFPIHAVERVLDIAGSRPSDLNALAYYEEPMLKTRRIISQIASGNIKGFKNRVNILRNSRLFGSAEEILHPWLDSMGASNVPVISCSHHMSHAWAAALHSPFDEASVLVVDAVGEYQCTSGWMYRDGNLEFIFGQSFPHSLGLFYSAMTVLCGFKVNDGEYKMMGLAPFGRPLYKELLTQYVLKVAESGAITLNHTYVDVYGKSLVTSKLAQLLGFPARVSDAPITQCYADLAASAQAVFEDVLAKLMRYLIGITGKPCVVLSGGATLNSAAVGNIDRLGIAEASWVFPGAGDAGSAIGAASAVSLALWPGEVNHKPKWDPYLGPVFSAADIEIAVQRAGLKYDRLTTHDLVRSACSDLKQGRIVGWFQGRMEFGPRALGNRSILADPSNPSTLRKVNMAIKYRESFRPVAPSILDYAVPDWTDALDVSPYMTKVVRLRDNYFEPDSMETRTFSTESELFNWVNESRSTVPAVTHVNGTLRPQSVDKHLNSKFYGLLEEWYQQSGLPMLCNTSLNRNGEPIACSPDDALDVFLGTNMDVIYLGNIRCTKRY